MSSPGQEPENAASTPSASASEKKITVGRDASIWKRIKESCDAIQSAFKVLSAAAMGTGILLIMAFCLKCDCRPHGLSLSEGFILVLTAFTFAWLHLILLALGLMAMLWPLRFRFTPRARIKPWVRASLTRDAIVLSFLGTFILAALVILLISQSKWEVALWVMTYPFVGILLLLSFAYESAESDPLSPPTIDQSSVKQTAKTSRTVAAAFGALLCVLPLIAANEEFFNVLMKATGIRTSSGTVLMTEENFNKISAVMEAINGQESGPVVCGSSGLKPITNDAVRMENNSNNSSVKSKSGPSMMPLVQCCKTSGTLRIVQNVTIYWHGTGDIAYAYLTNGSQDESANLVVELDDQGLWPIRGKGTKKIKCMSEIKSTATPSTQ